VLDATSIDAQELASRNRIAHIVNDSM